MKGKSVITPIGGLDSDSESRAVDSLSYRYALNIRNGVAYINDQNVVTNVKGSVKVNFTLPAGTNKCIGSYEDKQNGTVIYFVYNSLGNQSILQYTPSDTTPFGTVVELAQYDFGWTSTEFITGIDLVNGKLLYWTDSVMPRKLNIEKSALTGKVKTWDMFIPETLTTDAIVTFTFSDMDGVVIYTVGEVMTDPSDRQTIISDIAANLNANVNSPVTAEACACHLRFTEKVAGSVGSIVTDQLTPNGEFLMPIVPENWYGLELTDRMCDAGKWMPLFEPLATFEQDENYEPNYVQKKVFQFRLQYQYDDFEESALGVISQIPINNLGCDGTSNPLLNYIYIDFNEPDLIEIETLTILKKVTVLAREHNEGNWRSIIILEPCDFLDTDADGNLVCRYNFYGDIGGRAVDSVLVAKQYDNIPIEAGTQKFVKNRLNYGDVEIGRDAPDCIDAKPQMEFVETPNPKLWKITGNIRILTWGLIGSGVMDAMGNFYGTIAEPTAGYGGLAKYPFWESANSFANDRIRRGGIFRYISTEGSYPFFGGGAFDASTGTGVFENTFGIVDGMDSTYDQRIPEGGWPVYAAGTNYFTISKQIEVGLPSDDTGALDVSTAGSIESIGEYLFSNYSNIPPVSPDTDLYSTFELLVPDGVYVIRLASHWCSFGDNLEKGFAYDLSGGTLWQKTSTNVWSVLDTNGVQLKQKEITVTVSGGDVFIGSFLVADLAPPHNTNGSFGWRPLNSYLVSDENDSADINEDSFSGEPVEKTLVTYARCGQDEFKGSPIYSPVSPIQSHPYDTGWQNSCITDHNGYWFGITGICSKDGATLGFDYSSFNYIPVTAYQCDTGSANNIHKIKDEDTLLFIGSYSEYVTKELDGVAYDGSAVAGGLDEYIPQKLLHFFVATTLPNSRGYSSTTIEGTVIDQDGNNVPQVNVVFQSGRTVSTGGSGSYSLRAWSDMLTPNIPLFASEISTFNPVADAARIVDNIVFEGNLFCGVSYPNGQLLPISIYPFGINGTDAPPPYSPTALYDAGDFEIFESNNPSVKAHKRGGTYTYGLRLYDDLGRLCSVVKAFEMYVPFITEDIGKYDIEDFNGATYPTGTFRYGKPSIKWVLSSTTTFPTYAKYFQWMRTQNSIYGRYLQWVANQVTYLSATATSSTPEIETSFQNSDAVAIKISLSNITSYYAANNDSQVGYTYQAGDRLRLIADRNLVNYSSDNFPSIENNVNDFEITSYDSTTQSVIIKPNGFPLEIQSGTLFEIFNPKSVETQDGQLFYEVGEVFTVTNGVPDTLSGTFTNGDTYWRGRLIIVNDDATKFASAYPVVIEDASVSDFYSSLDEDIGRAGLIDPNFKQLRYPTRMQCSNVYIAGTTINGLASFESLNFKELDRAFGTMKRMFYIGQVMLTVHENKLVSNYIELRSLSDANTTDGLLAISDAYYGNNRPSQTDNGCQNGESCIEYNGKVWGIDADKGLVWQYDNNGDSAISAYKMISFFKDFCVKGVEWCIPAYDKYRNELIFSIKNSEETITIAYDNAKNRWTSFYSFKPEYFGNVGTNVVSFVNGELYAMDKSDTYNNFFGVQYDSRLTIIPNDNSELNKVWDAIKLENLEDADKMSNNWEVFSITNNNGQLSRLLKNKFRKIEYFFYTTFLRDMNDVSVTNPVMNGRELRSPYLICEMKNDTTGQFQLRSVVVDYTTSQRT